MDVKLINPFLESITNVLSTMAQIKCTPNKVALKRDEVAQGDVSGIIGMVGDKMNGSFALSFSEPVIFLIAKNMLGEEPDCIDDTVIDMVGELTNMATGGAKLQLSKQGYEFGMATPVVVKGPKHQIAHTNRLPVLSLPFTTANGKFYVEICFQELG